MNEQRLLALLALHDRSCLRAYIAGTLWLRATDQRAFANLRASIWRLRRAGFPLIVATVSHVGLAEGIDVDVRRAIAASRQAIEDPETRAYLPDDYFSGDLLPDWYDDWVGDERERLRQLRVHALESVGETLLERGQFGQAVDACLLGVQLDPLRESMHRLLIRVYLAEGNASDALRQYDVYTQRLGDAVGLEPSAQMRELVHQLRIP
jgi:DNA-binding SARP family transcriptional activator